MVGWTKIDQMHQWNRDKLKRRTVVINIPANRMGWIFENVLRDEFGFAAQQTGGAGPVCGRRRCFCRYGCKGKLATGTGCIFRAFLTLTIFSHRAVPCHLNNESICIYIALLESRFFQIYRCMYVSSARRHKKPYCGSNWCLSQTGGQTTSLSASECRLLAE